MWLRKILIAFGLVTELWTTTSASGQDAMLSTLFPKGFGESQLQSINEEGVSVGRCEVFDIAGNANAVLNLTFSCKKVGVLPNVPGYRHVDLFAISDNAIVVGHAYGPLNNGGKALQAIAIDCATGALVDLPLLSATHNSVASAISTDGKTIAGVCSGHPCIWKRTGDIWAVSDLMQDDCTSTRLVLSPNGEIAACAARHLQENVLLLWQHDDSGWKVAKRISSGLTPFDVNDRAMIAGAMNIRVDGATVTRGFVLGQDDTPIETPPLTDDNFSIARSINNHGVAVGWSDCVGDASKHPRAIKWNAGLTSELSLAESIASQAYAINDHGDIAGLLSRRMMIARLGSFFILVRDE